MLKKINKKMFKIIAITLVLFILNATISPMLFAASGSGRYVGGQFASYIKTQESDGEYGVLIRNLTDLNTGGKKTVFCAEYGVPFTTGNIYDGTYFNPSNPDIKKACKIAYFGWYEKYGNYVVDGGISNDRKKDYTFTQVMIWQSLGQNSGVFLNSGNQSEYNSFKADVESKIANVEKRPSIESGTIELDIGNTITVTDSNGVLKDYKSIDATSNGIRFQHTKGENTLTIIATNSCTLEAVNISDATSSSWGLVKEDSIDQDTTLYYTFAAGIQNQVYSLNYNDPVPLRLSLKINQYGKLELTKTNTNAVLLDGAVFNVTGPNGYNKDVTVKNGKLTIEELLRGEYTIKEVKAPDRHFLNTNTFKVTVTPNQTVKQTVVNEEFSKLELTKTNIGIDLVDGAVFNVTGPNGYNKNITVTGGKIIIDELRKGEYTIKEVSVPAGYLLNINTFKITLSPGNTWKQTIKNEEPTGSISIIKRDSQTGNKPQGDAILRDATYKLYANQDIYNVAKTIKYYSKGDLVATRTTDNIGKTQDITGLPLGKYIVKEEKASLGYLIDNTTYEIELKYKDQNTKIITNTTTSNEVVKKQGVHIFKSGINEQSGMVQGLEGAEFTIKLNSDVQKALDSGYTYAEIWQGIDEDGNKVTVDSNRVAKAQAIAPTCDTIITDSEGNAYTINLPYGKYITKETVTPKDFITAADFTFSITQDTSEISDIALKVKDIVVNNEQMESYIKLIKKDLKSDKIVSLSSATFQIKASKDIYDRGNGKILYKAGEIIKHKIGSTTYDSFTTNADNIVVPQNSYTTDKENNGTVITPLMLQVGSYEVTEIKIPNGFLQLDIPLKFNIENVRNYDTDPDGDYVQEVIIKNEQPTGTLLLDKNVALRKDVDKSIIDTSDLSRIKFRLAAKEDIIDMVDGSVVYTKGTIVGEYNLTKEGRLKVDNLWIGTYELSEIETLPGLVLSEEKHEVKFTYKDTVTRVYNVEKEIENKTTIFEISKTDITGEQELKGAKLEIRDNENNIVDSWTSTDKPHTIEGLIVGKTYTLIETLAPNKYVVATSIEFTVQNTDEVQKVHMVDKQILVSKTDITGESELEGAELEIQDLEGNTIDKWISSKEPHFVSGLEENKTYKLIERTAPEEYVVATEVEFTVSTDKEVQKVYMVDKQVIISKTDSLTSENIEGAELEVVDEEGNVLDSWITEKEPHYVSGLIEGQEYEVIEKLAPYGYYIAENVKFTATTDKENQEIQMQDAPILRHVRVEKIDNTTKEHIKSNKFVFGIYSDPECKNLITESGANTDEGTALFENLRYGTYYIKERKAPTGYKLSEQVVTIEINDNGVFADGVLLGENDNIYSFEYYNSLLPVIQTGNIRTIVWYAIAGISVLGLFLVKIYNKKKRK